MKKQMVLCIGAQIRAILISVVMLALLAVLVEKGVLAERFQKIGIVSIYMISNFLTGRFLGRRIEERRYLWGCLAGLLYFFLWLIVSVIGNIGNGFWNEQYITVFFVCLGSGMLGGMFS